MWERKEVSQKIKEKEELRKILDNLKTEGKKIVFTNGCFDLVHVGHIRYLKEAKKLGDVLVVAINSDESVKSIKGEERPIIPQEERAEIIASFECVDHVGLCVIPDHISLIICLKPDFLVKGGDWGKDTIVGRDFVEATGGRVVRVPLIKGASATQIIQRILSRYSTYPQKKGLKR